MQHEENLASEFELRDSELMVCCTDAQSRIAYVNPCYLRVTGYTVQELKAMPAAERIRDTPAQVLIDASTTARAGKPWTGVIKMARKDGPAIWCRLNVAPLFSQSQFIGSLMVAGTASAAESRETQALYAALASGNGRNDGWRHGRHVRLNLRGKLVEKLGSLGLMRHVLCAMAALDSAGAVGLAMMRNILDTSSLGIAMGALVGATALAGWYLSRNVVAPLRDAVRVSDRIAAGDLSTGCASARRDEVGDVLRSLNQVSVNVRATLLDVRDGVTTMQQATREIASGTFDLSARTESQASSLEETAASMEQINATVRHNADAAQQAHRLAALAFEVARTGGGVIAEVIATMETIAHSSSKIADIISVIDGIAFQTNILALNAAVEAARAGELGRSFAVVAAEVRSLAQRSTQAAREIRTLISDSAGRVNEGSRLVDSAGKAIGDIVSQVRGVSDLIGQIADASREQSTGVGQVGQAVEQLDQMTQVNSTLVEAHTVSAQSLKMQAERLVDALSVFTLSDADAEMRAPGSKWMT